MIDPAPSITFVTCVEAGPLEPMALRLFESMRRFGGRFSKCPLIAVKPRLGAPLSKDTLAKFKELDATYLSLCADDGAGWATFANKTRAVAAVENIATTDCIAFLDGDILVTGEPVELILGPDESFAACAIHEKGVASAGPHDPLEPFWTGVFDALGVDLSKMPFLQTTSTRERVRMHFNGGVFVYRRNSRLGSHSHQAFLRLLQAKVAHVNLGIHMFDEVSLAAMVCKHDLRWRALTNSHNCSIPSWTDGGYQPALYRGAKLLHYHNAMAAENWRRFLSCLNAEHPDMGAWLARFGPITRAAPVSTRALAFCLLAWRTLHRKKHLRQCVKLGI